MNCCMPQRDLLLWNYRLERSVATHEWGSILLHGEISPVKTQPKLWEDQSLGLFPPQSDGPDPSRTTGTAKSCGLYGRTGKRGTVNIMALLKKRKSFFSSVPFMSPWLMVRWIKHASPCFPFKLPLTLPVGCFTCWLGLTFSGMYSSMCS